MARMVRNDDHGGVCYTVAHMSNSCFGRLEHIRADDYALCGIRHLQDQPYVEGLWYRQQLCDLPYFTYLVECRNDIELDRRYHVLL